MLTLRYRLICFNDWHRDNDMASSADVRINNIDIIDIEIHLNHQKYRYCTPITAPQ